MANDDEVDKRELIGRTALVAVIVLCITAYEIAKLFVGK